MSFVERARDLMLAVMAKVPIKFPSFGGSTISAGYPRQ